MERYLTWSETLYVLEKDNDAWNNFAAKYYYNNEASFNNPYNMITEKTFSRYGDDSWTEIGSFPLPFIRYSSEVANKEHITYKKENNKEYFYIGDCRYLINDAVRTLFN